jgi:hypothetical protein
MKSGTMFSKFHSFSIFFLSSIFPHASEPNIIFLRVIIILPSVPRIHKYWPRRGPNLSESMKSRICLTVIRQLVNVESK